jgi:Right handed beta helix region
VDTSRSDDAGGCSAATARATSGDHVEPGWEERLRITVGPEKADLIGSDHKVLQAAIDYVARLGGGTVHVLPGTYRLRNAVHLASKVRLVGSGPSSVLIKEPSVSARLSASSDWFDQEITLKDSAGFEVGDGVCVRGRDPDHGGTSIVKGTLVARSGNRFKLDRALRENFWLRGEASVATLFPLLSGEDVVDVVIENLTLDGNKEQNQYLDGNHAGGIFLQRSSRVTMRDLTVRCYNGDGISWQICHDVIVESCQIHDHAEFALHPGSGSQRPIIRGNTLERNEVGLYICWGVRHGLIEKNVLEDNRSCGISIGHRDADNVIRDNIIRRSGKIGVLFRSERGFAAHRNRIENNRIVDSGMETGVGIDIQGETESIHLAANELQETREPHSRIGIRIGPLARDIQMVDNRTEGFAVSVADLRRP